MWFKYLIISVHQKNLKIGMKYSDTKKQCIIGGQKKFMETMNQIAETYFGVNRQDIHVSFPQTYKIKLTFDCTEEMVERCRDMFRREQAEFMLMEVGSLDRTMR